LVWVYRAYAKERGDLILQVMSVGGLALVALALAVVWGVALAMRLLEPRKPSNEPWVIQAGAPFTTGYTLALSAWIPLVQISLDWEAPPGFEATLAPWRGRLREELIAHRRALVDGFTRRLTFVDAFGMAKVVWRVRVAQPIKVMPARGRLEPRQLLQQLASGDLVSHPDGEPDGDLMEMRRYQHGDPLKRILWKTYARTRKILVRQPERAIAPRQKTLAYLVASHDDEPTAGTARTALELGFFGPDFVFRADGADASTNQIPEAVEQIVRSSRLPDRDGGRGLGTFLDEERGDAKACLVFVPQSPGPWLQPLLEQAHRRKGRLSVVIGVDRLQTGSRPSLLRRLLFDVGDRSYKDRVAALRQICEPLSAAGAPIVILDRNTGQPIPPHQLQGPR
jgi:hypothetical protein